MVLRGDGHRVFPYFDGYRFNVRSSFTFTVADTRHTQLIVTAYEKSFTAVEQAPAFKFELRQLPR